MASSAGGRQRSAAVAPVVPASKAAWAPFPGFQVRALACDAFEALIGGAAGPGKTDVLIAGATRYVHKPWCKALIIREQYTDLLEVLDRAHVLYPKLGGVWEATEKRYVWPSGGWVKFGHCASYKEAVKSHRGQEYTYLGIDELGEFREERTYLFLVSRVRSTDPEGKKLLMVRGSANPGGLGHAWVKARFVEPTLYGKNVYTDPVSGKTRAFVPGKLEDNPLIYEEYFSVIMMQDELTRGQLLGDWDLAAGMAYPELVWEVVRCEPIAPTRIPAHWELWGGHDWGFAHWAVTVFFGQDHQGQVYVIDTVWSRRLQVPQLCEEMWEKFPIERCRAVYAGHDIFQELRAKGEDGISLEDKYLEASVPVARAVKSRKNRYQYCRDALSWMNRGPHGSNRAPRVLFCDTPGNVRLFKQLKAMVCDPDDPETILKVDCNATSGEGGDDGSDAFTFGLATHAPIPTDPIYDEQARAFSDAALQHEVETGRRVSSVAASQLTLPALGSQGGEVE